MDSVPYLCRDGPSEGFHDLHMVGFFLIVPSPLEGETQEHNDYSHRVVTNVTQ